MSVVLAFALGIGANIGILAVCLPMFLHAVPFDQADRIAVLLPRNDSQGISEGLLSLAEIEIWRQESEALDEVAAYASRPAILSSDRGAERVRAPWVSANLFAVVGIKVDAGRALVPLDETPGNQRVAVLSHGFWKRRFGGRPAVGETISLDGEGFEVVGVAAEQAVFPVETDLWVPAARLPVRMNPRLRLFRAVAKLGPGVSIEEAREEAKILEQAFARAHPDVAEGWTVDLKLLEDRVLESVRAPLLLLAAAGTVVLLIALVNVFNLLLAEGSGRIQRTTMVMILGARRRDLVREQSVFVLMLAALGGSVSFLLALFVSRLLLTTESLSLPYLHEGTTFQWIIQGTILSILGAGALLGVLLALLGSRCDFTTVQRGEGPTTRSDATTGRGRRVLIAAQVALSFLLLVVAGLLLNSFMNLIRQDLGYSPQGVFSAELSLSPGRYRDEASWRRAFESVVEQVASAPWASSTGLVTGFPLGGRFMVGNASDAGGESPPVVAGGVEADVRITSEGYFETLGIPILRGRGFGRRDTADGVATAIVNLNLAERLWPNGGGIGKGLMLSSHPETRFEVIGVVGNVRQLDLAQEPTPEVYLTFRQFPSPWMQLVVRSSGGTVVDAEALREVLFEIDKHILVESTLPMPEVLRGSLSAREFLSSTLGGFASIAAAQSVLGVFSVGMLIVSRQRRSYGIRLALGADKMRIFKLVFGQEFVWVLYGLMAGILVSVAATRLLSSFLYGVSAADPLTFTGAASLLALAAALACLLPAYRASRVAPVVTLREM